MENIDYLKEKANRSSGWNYYDEAQYKILLLEELKEINNNLSRLVLVTKKGDVNGFDSK